MQQGRISKIDTTDNLLHSPLATVIKSELTLRQTITVATSHNFSESKTGIGILIQETTVKGRRGPITEERAETYSLTDVSHKNIELFAIFRAFQLAVERGYTHVTVRSDYNCVRKRVQNAIKNTQPVLTSSLLERLLILTSAIEQVKMEYCQRRKNSIAHGLARKGAGILPKPKPNYEDVKEYWLYEQYEYADNDWAALF